MITQEMEYWFPLVGGICPGVHTSSYWQLHSKMEICDVKQHLFVKAAVLCGTNAQDCHAQLQKALGRCKHSKVEETELLTCITVDILSLSTQVHVKGHN